MPELKTHCNATLIWAPLSLGIRSTIQSIRWNCWSYRLLLEMKEQNKTCMSAGERRDRMSCGMWCLWLVGQSEVMVCSHLPGFSGASVTFSWTSLGITKIKPNRPVNVRLLSAQLFTALVHHEKQTPLKHGRSLKRLFTPALDFYFYTFTAIMNNC